MKLPSAVLINYCTWQCTYSYQATRNVNLHEQSQYVNNNDYQQAVYLQCTVTFIAAVGPSPKSLNGVQVNFTSFILSVTDVVYTTATLLPVVLLNKLSCSL